MEIQKIKLSELKPAKYNPRKNLKPGDAEFEHIKNSIEKFGYIDPIIYNTRNNIIVGGHQRYKVLKELGYDEIDAVGVDMDEATEKACNAALNKAQGDWDIEKLDALLEDLKMDYDMSLFGFENPAEDEEKEAEEDNYDEQLPAEPKSKPGQLYKLGDHYLLCGDSTKEEDVKKLLQGQEMDLVVTDPPYNVNLGTDNSGHKLRPSEEIQRKKRTDGTIIKNDAWNNDDDFIDFLVKAFANLKEALKPGGAFYIWYADMQALNFRIAAKEAGITIRENLIWNKNTITLGRQDYQWKHEPCLYGWTDGAAHYFIDDRTQATVIEDKKQDFKTMKKEELVSLLEELYADKISTTIINEKKPAASDLHPTMKPIKLIARLVKNSSKPGEKVLDLFGGSGTTLMVCEQLGRQCFMIEYDPVYMDVIIDRWEKYTGEKAELISE